MNNTAHLLRIFILLFVLSFAVFVATGCCPEKGDRGATGSDGAIGNTGPAGPQGLPGVAPTVTVSPATSAQCPAGGTVAVINGMTTVICNGMTGATGATGNQGNAGHNGLNGTTVIPVSFCGGPSIYPSHFPEFGLLINGAMFGVYSANDGFLALLPPGLYSSNAIGSSCTFRINVDGTVSRQ